MKKKPEEMNLGELVQAVVQAEIYRYSHLSALDGKGSPYANEQDARAFINDEVDGNIKPIMAELSKYTKK